ncbi:hypothetical protein B0T21DRAFT_42881 [Apiosordaria backusii]|uniref:Uncharacterized protein n=1 Tax=Apiosordaria backusii TaxID=314023 RepID=A0AA40E1N9_9PEZI|nr:hypothetical protein B0T21DRAFT_42881 [Apiosordaria backusii]
MSLLIGQLARYNSQKQQNVSASPTELVYFIRGQFLSSRSAGHHTPPPMRAGLLLVQPRGQVRQAAPSFSRSFFNVCDRSGWLQSPIMAEAVLHFEPHSKTNSQQYHKILSRKAGYPRPGTAKGAADRSRLASSSPWAEKPRVGLQLCCGFLFCSERKNRWLGRTRRFEFGNELQPWACCWPSAYGPGSDRIPISNLIVQMGRCIVDGRERGSLPPLPESVTLAADVCG